MNDDRPFGEVDAIARARHEAREQRLAELRAEYDRLESQDSRLAEILAEIEVLTRATTLAPVILSAGWVATPPEDGEPEVVRWPPEGPANSTTIERPDAGG